jgi:hypothetical protein
MKSIKLYAYRATMLLGTFAAFAVLLGDGAKRWS